MTYPLAIKMYYFAVICCVLMSTVCGVDLSDSVQRKQSKTYPDLLHDVSTIVEHYGKPEQTNLMKSLNNQIYGLYFPVKLFVESTNSELDSKSGNTKFRNAGIVSEMLSESQSADLKLEKYQNVYTEPAVLYTMINFIKRIIPDWKTKSNTSSSCIEDVGRLITSLLSKESWAVQFFDAMGKPGPSLTRFHLNFIGNYDQCLASVAPLDPANKALNGFTGNYFRIKFLTSNPLFVPQIGTCLPDTCSSVEISRLVQEIINGRKIGGMSVFAYAEKLPQPTEMTTATICAICILTLIGIMMVIGTFIDIVIVKSWKDKDPSLMLDGHDKTDSTSDNVLNAYQTIDGSLSSVSLRSDEINRNRHPINDENAPLIYSPSNSTRNPYTQAIRHKTNVSNYVMKVFLAFSIYTNGKNLLNTKQKPGSLGAIHGIRFLSMSWVVLCHWYAFSLSYLLNAYDEVPKMINRWSFLPILNGFSSVDSFFTLSGLLTSYLTIQEMNRKQSPNINWFMFYFHRFWRLTPPYMLSILVVLGFSQYLGEGPMWSVTQPGDKVACEKNWWTNLLYVNNLVKTDEVCFGHSWYLANDMQFFVSSPLILIPFYFNKLYGLLSCSVVLLTSWITTGVLSTIHKWPTTSVSLHPVPDRAGQPEYFFHYYIVPWCRIGPFVVGIMAGYLLALTKGRQFKMPWWVVILGWMVSIATGLAVVYGLRGDITGDSPSSIGAAALYNAISRSAWGMCVCWVVIVCSAGYGGPINTLLSWSPFVVLGRLTYMVYLIHLCIGGTFYQSLGALIYFNDQTMVTTFLGVFTVINMVSFVAVLALESPMLGLEKIFFKRDRGN